MFDPYRLPSLRLCRLAAADQGQRRPGVDEAVRRDAQVGPPAGLIREDELAPTPLSPQLVPAGQHSCFGVDDAESEGFGNSVYGSGDADGAHMDASKRSKGEPYRTKTIIKQ